LVSKEVNVKVNEKIFLKIEVKAEKYAFYFATKKNQWQIVLDNADGKYLSTKSAGGFVGCMYAMYATSNGNASDNTASFDWFEIKNNDEIYK